MASVYDNETAMAARMNNPLGEMTEGCAVFVDGKPVHFEMHGQAYAADDEAMQEAFEERAAIMEHDGGLTREEAEAAAKQAQDDTYAPLREMERIHQERRRANTKRKPQYQPPFCKWPKLGPSHTEGHSGTAHEMRQADVVPAE